MTTTTSAATATTTTTATTATPTPTRTLVPASASVAALDPTLAPARMHGNEKYSSWFSLPQLEDTMIRAMPMLYIAYSS